MLVSFREIINEKKAVIEAGNLPTLNIIPVQFAQLLINILLNSLKYSKDHVPPHIRIDAEAVKGSEIENYNSSDDVKYWKISVIDNGIGFEQQYEERIFELFQRLNGRNEYSGTGAGLAICRKIVQNHNGIITAKGEPEIGAVFNIYLPINKN